MSQKVVQLSCHKYSSNVIEKFLENDPKNLEAFLTGAGDRISGKSANVVMMRNPYGNYVVQKALKLSAGDLRKRLIDCVLKGAEEIEDKKLSLKWRNIALGNADKETKEKSSDELSADQFKKPGRAKSKFFPDLVDSP